MSGPRQTPPEREQAPADHDDVHDHRDGVADQRDRLADDRDHLADERDKAGELRDEAASVRDLASGRRDVAAGHRDCAADQRDALASRREKEADALEQPQSARTAVARLAAAARHEAALDRRRASRDREAGAGEREQAERDRRTARADRGSGAVDRRSAGEDRGASARDRKDASLDSLTGAYLRGAGLLQLEREVMRAQRTGKPLTVAFLDVDRLKAVNDTAGHAAGDRLLIRVAETLRHRLRSYDLVIRYGGDEFVCVFPDARAPEAERRLQLVNEDLEHHGSISFGVATGRPGEGSTALVERADAALYAARATRPVEPASSRSPSGDFPPLPSVGPVPRPARAVGPRPERPST